MKTGLLSHMTWPIAKRSALIAAVVGSLLCLINHSDKMISGTVTGSDLLRMGLTYLVPFCVATFGALTARAETQRIRKRRNG